MRGLAGLRGLICWCVCVKAIQAEVFRQLMLVSVKYGEVFTISKYIYRNPLPTVSALALPIFQKQ